MGEWNTTHYTGLGIGSGIINVSGTLTNTLALAFFLARERQGLTNKLFLLLHSFDLAVCVTSCLQTLHFVHGIYFNPHAGSDEYTAHGIFTAVYFGFMESAAFATCLLSVTRTISLCRPLYHINRKLVVFALITFLILVAVQASIFMFLSQRIQFVDLPLFFSALFLMGAVVAVANAALIINLWNLSSRDRDTDNRVTVTVVILSALFYSLNGMYLTYLGLFVFIFATGNFEAFDNFPIFLQIVTMLAVPLKSAVNPAVRLIRDPGIRQFVEHVWSTIICGQREEIPRMHYAVLEEAE